MKVYKQGNKALLMLLLVLLGCISTAYSQDDASTEEQQPPKGEDTTTTTKPTTTESTTTTKTKDASFNVENEDWGSYYDPKNVFCGQFDCYQILGFDYENFDSYIDTKLITKRYRALSREWHPDKSKHKDAKERFVVRDRIQGFLPVICIVCMLFDPNLCVFSFPLLLFSFPLKYIENCTCI